MMTRCPCPRTGQISTDRQHSQDERKREHHVVALAPGSPAALSGRISAGDVLIKVILDK